MSLAGPSIADAPTLAPARAGGGLRGWTAIYLDLTKARLSALVVMTAAVGYLVASPRAIDWIGFLFTTIGVALASGCANAFNQIIEVERDRLMPRTASRPLPGGRMSRPHAIIAATLMGYLGVGVLAIFTNLTAAGLALLTIILYTLFYTPLKTRSTLNTWFGAIVGGIPPIIGWVAAAGRIEYGAWMLGALLFVWQLPHFLALAWMYREQYEQGGFKMLPSVDPAGWLTGRIVIITSLLLLPVTLAATLVGMSGWLFAIAAMILGIWMVVLSVRFARAPAFQPARRLFLASIIYLPLVLVAMLADRAILGPSQALAEDRATIKVELRPESTSLSDSNFPLPAP